MKDLFKKLAQTAQDSKKEYDSEKKHSEVNTKTCNSCGAPRPKTSNLVTCEYCKTPFMNIDTQIKTDV